MIFSSMIPSSLIDADWSRLLGVGVIFIFIGIVFAVAKLLYNYKYPSVRMYVGLDNSRGK